MFLDRCFFFKGFDFSSRDKHVRNCQIVSWLYKHANTLKFSLKCCIPLTKSKVVSFPMPVRPLFSSI